MTIKLLQLNIERGKRIDAVIEYIQSGRFDIVCLQEVSSGSLNYAKENCFETLTKRTGLSGTLSIYTGVKNEVTSFIGLTTLNNKKCHIVANHVIWLKRFQEVSGVGRYNYAKIPRCASAILFDIGAKPLMVINTHLAWGPTSDDRVYQKNQAEKLYQWIRTHRQDPFVLTGDFNLNPHTFTVGRLSSLGNNLTKRFKITNTLNPRTHRVKALFPSGLPVDYIIADERLAIKKFFVEEKVDLSDHFGLVVHFVL